MEQKVEKVVEEVETEEEESKLTNPIEQEEQEEEPQTQLESQQQPKKNRIFGWIKNINSTVNTILNGNEEI